MTIRRPIAAALLVLALSACSSRAEPTAAVGEGAAATSPGSEPTGSTDCRVPTLPTSGTTLSPRDLSQGFGDFFAEARELGPVIGWGGTIDHVADPEGAARVLASLCSEHGYAVFLQTSPFRQHEPGFAVPFEAADRQRHLDDLVALVSDHTVAFLAIGVEVNFWRERTSSEDWRRFVGWYDEAYEAVKAASPTTLVFPTFQYERMAGEHGGLWGPDEAPGEQWDALDELTRRDLTAFTTYPHLVRPDPLEVEDAYWAPIREHVDGPIAFTEVGWPAHDVAPGYESDPTEQAAFVDRFFDLAPAADLVIWPFVYDPDVGPPFDSLGIRDDVSGPRPALERWVARTP